MTILGGAMFPHAPQFFTLPETEDKANVAQVQAVARRIGERLKALRPEVWISFSNDHAFQFFQKVAPPFTLHVGGEAEGEFAGRKFSLPRSPASSPSAWCASSTAWASTPRSPAPRRSTTRSAFR